MAITIHNETPSKLTLVGIDDQTIVFSPLEAKRIEEPWAFQFEDVEREGIVRRLDEGDRGLTEKISGVIVGGGVWLVAICAGIASMDPWIDVSESQWRWIVWLTGAVILLVIVTAMIIRSTSSFSIVARVTTQVMALLVILAIGLGLPAATIYFFGGGHEMLTEWTFGSSDAEAPASPVTTAPASSDTGAFAEAGSDTSAPLALFGRLVQLAFIATASLLPVLLFFLFDRYQLGTLRRRLYSSLFRLDRSVQTIGALHAKYGSQIQEAFGSDDQGRGRLAPGSRWPVLVCAFVITIGWIVALAPVGTAYAPKTNTEVLAALLPQPTALVFGFLGVYFFSLRLIAIRYARGDLKPKAYTHIMVRIFIVAVLSWVLDAMFPDDSVIMLVLAFLFGITPDEFFTWLKEWFRGKPGSKQVEAAVPETIKLPLNELEGIDLYDLGRLESEGIVNIEGLAHHELIDLIIETRMPVPRLIDWMDQAILYLHLAGGTDNKARAKLRDYGIRTATDLLRTWDEAVNRDPPDIDSFKKLLGETGPPYRLEVIRDALLDDEWMEAVLCWRKDEPHAPINKRVIPTSVDALERLADKLKDEDRYGSALGILEQSLRVRDTASARLRMAHIYATSPVAQYQDPDRAREHAQRTYALAPRNLVALKELMEIYIRIEDFDAANRMCEEAQQLVEEWKNGKRKTKETNELKERQQQIAGLMDGGSGAAAPADVL